MKKILSIIVSYNFEPWLDKCLSSLIHSELQTDIIVIDNASKDDTVARIQKQYPQVRLVANQDNLGFGKANNIGLDIARDEGYEYAFLINQDAWIAPDCLTHLTRRTENKYGIISPTHMDGTEKSFDTGFKEYVRHAKLTLDGFYQVDFINAAFWLIPRSVLLKVGGFSPIFYHYGEDKDYANRIRFHKLQTVYHPLALAYHDRQDRKVTFVDHIKADYVFYLTEYCNINYSFFKAFTSAIGGACKKCMQALIARNMKKGQHYLKMSWTLLSQTSAVLNTRKSNKITNKAIH